MFIGEYQHSIDSKNRIIVPSKFRDELGEKFVITKGLDSCLYAYPMGEWANLEQKLKALPLTSKDARAFVRFIFSGASDCELDKQGRFVIPANLLEYANIKKDVVTIGVATRFEIWSRENWEQYNNSNIDFDEIADKMSQLGI
ncbi:MAG: division/cell wall cluster transcriptional repressor MraZ [Clostridiales bacterium]|nr:division/cell wall cluster transcriptional repressor MraZ [Clostridiales bacterium]HBM81810.1 cell division/cell wall cluster transcriptional repressor MraZ [Clostridiaceae bacterium]